MPYHPLTTSRPVFVFILQAHVDKTGSPRGKAILADWDDYLPKFWQLVPPAEKNTPEANPEVPKEAPITVKVAITA